MARALALNPAILLLDEPFTGLDMPSQELLTDLFTTLARERDTNPGMVRMAARELSEVLGA